MFASRSHGHSWGLRAHRLNLQSLHVRSFNVLVFRLLPCVSQADFERVIDIFEKIVYVDQKQSRDHLVTRFCEVAPKELQARIPKGALELIYNKYWKDEREKRKRSFLRLFWEKADFDD